MTALKNTGIRIVVLLVLQTLWLEASHSQNPGSPAISTEVSKQEGIFRSEREQLPEGYTIDRSLLDYTRGLSSEFDRSLANLGPRDRWLDIGAGTGQAILDYYTPDYDLRHWEGWERRSWKAQAVAISIEDRRTSHWRKAAAGLGENKLQYLFNKRLREYSLGELGKFQVITDVIGGFSYTQDLSLFMENVLGFLELNGSFFSVLQDVHSENGANRPFYAGSPYLIEIENTDGSEMKVCSWLKSITCVEVTCEFRARWTPPVEAFRVRKVCNDVAVPALLPIHYLAGTPPERRFRMQRTER